MARQCISPEIIMKGFKRCCVSSALEETDDDLLWNGSEEDGIVNVRKMKALTVQMETVRMIGKGR